MRDDICTIPISEVFEETDGCPLCRMRSMAEDRAVDYILGAAMMEPDVRIRSNELGFCGVHLKMMMGRQKRLPLALILETHLDEIGRELFSKSLMKPSAKKQAYKTVRTNESCFVCEMAETAMSAMVGTTIKTYIEQQELRDMFGAQEYICLPHYGMLCEAMAASPQKAKCRALQSAAAQLCERYLCSLKADIHAFTDLFDYRAAERENEPSEEEKQRVKSSIDRAFEFLTARDPKKL